MTANAVTILLVDDDKVDVMAIRRSFRQLHIDNPVIEARNGLEALAHLRGQNGFTTIRSPCLVLLDLNMPCMDGFEFLEELRSDPALRPTLVFVMTTSAAEEDRLGAYTRNVAGYILKHRPQMGFLKAISMLEDYWQVIEFPA